MRDQGARPRRPDAGRTASSHIRPLESGFRQIPFPDSDPMTEIAPDSATADAPRAVIVGAGPSGFYAADQLLGAGLRGRRARRAADAVRAGARGRRAGPPEDQVRHAGLREDRAAKDGFRFFGGVELGAT